MAKSDELLKQMYDSNLASQKAALQSDYDAALADLNAQKANNQRNAEQNVRLTKAEADKAAVNRAEYYEAAGLSSGAKAQARVAQDNQLLADLTAIRAAQQQGDINIERQRGLLGQQFAAAIREAQANNDMARAQALYEQAKEAEANLLKQQQAEYEQGQKKLDKEYEDKLKYALEVGDYKLYEELIRQGRPVYVPSSAAPTDPTATTGTTAPFSSNATMKSIVALGGPLTPEAVAQLVASGLVRETTDQQGNIIFAPVSTQRNPLPGSFDRNFPGVKP